MDLKVKPYAAKQGLIQPRDADADGEVLAGDVVWMRDKWCELMVKFYGQEPTPMPSPQQPPGMDNVVAEMRERLKASRAPSHCADAATRDGHCSKMMISRLA